MNDQISEEELALLNKGYELDSEGKTEQALEAFEFAAKANYLCAPAAFNARGIIFFDERQYAKAEQEFRRVLELVPFNSKASYYLYSTLSLTRRSGEAVEEGIRFFDGRKSNRLNDLILDYKRALENRLANDSELES